MFRRPRKLHSSQGFFALLCLVVLFRTRRQGACPTTSVALTADNPPNDDGKFTTEVVGAGPNSPKHPCRGLFFPLASFPFPYRLKL
jgi:hypothetical protein